ncbi:MAG: hypothetical protein K0V04_41545 [Deltaproteobacteria bacterium]|nr:hypothetical protein [Deltaproteobacteria bacterium]
MRSSTLVSCLLVAAMSSGCATAYKSYYRETNHKIAPRPVPSEDVKVFKSADDLATAVDELGIYKGHAPTVTEAMDAAKSMCGPAGAEYFILYTEPYEARGVWKIDGYCAVRAGD